MDNNILKIIVGLVLVYLIYKNYSNCKKIENMSNTTTIRDEINKIYKADVQSIRNLEAISKKLQEGGLTVAGDLTVDGNIKVKKSMEVTDNLTVKKDSTTYGQTTINKLYGGQSTGGGWRDIIVNGGHLRFVIGNNKFGFHNNDNGLHFYKGNNQRNLPIWPGIYSKGDVQIANGKTIRGDGRLHIAPNERLYLLPKTGTWIEKSWGSDGTLNGNNNVVVTDKTLFLRSRRNNTVLQNTYNTAAFNNWNKQAWERMYIQY